MIILMMLLKYVIHCCAIEEFPKYHHHDLLPRLLWLNHARHYNKSKTLDRCWQY